MDTHIIGLFGLLALGTILFVIQMFIPKRSWFDVFAVLTALFCWVSAAVGFVKLAFGT